MNELTKEIFSTLAYADIFDYPLTEEEVCHYLISFKLFERGAVLKGLRVFADKKLISADEGYYFLNGRKKIVGLRKKRERLSQSKIRKAERIARFLKIIPWIKLVGISGSLAMKNCNEDEDIDLLIITSARRLWLTRLLVTVLVGLIGQRRKPPGNGQSPMTVDQKDKICLNMFLDEEHLAVPPQERNLFAAHEVVQMKKIWDRGGVYGRFLAANLWVGKWMANCLGGTEVQRYRGTENKVEKLCTFTPLPRRQAGLYLCALLDGLEKLAMLFQLKYMSKRRTIEKVESGRIMFHPEDISKRIMREYQKRIAGSL